MSFPSTRVARLQVKTVATGAFTAFKIGHKHSEAQLSDEMNVDRRAQKPIDQNQNQTRGLAVGQLSLPLQT